MADALVKSDPFLPANISDAEKLATTLSKSALLPEALRGKPGDVLVTIITGHELGLSPMQAIRGMHVVKGRAIMSADLAVALVKRHPDCQWFRLVESTDKIATYETLRKGEPSPTTMSFTAAQAHQAGLGGDNWRKYPAAMLRARCSLALARAVFPDTMLGVYDPDEIPEAQTKPERTVAPPPPSNVRQLITERSLKELQAIPEDAEFSEPPTDNAPPPSDADMPFVPPEPAKPFDPMDEALALLDAAKTQQDLAGLTEKIIALGVSKDPKFRAAYSARVAAIKRGAA